jgi:hypothetical protein
MSVLAYIKDLIMNSIHKYVNDGYILITDIPFETWNIVEMEWANTEMLIVC